MKNNKRNYFRAECLKQKHSLGMKASWIMAIAAAGVACVMNGNYAVISGYNWWYAFFLPGLVILNCFLIIRRDQKVNNYTLLLLPLNFKKVWDMKILVCAANLLTANGILFMILLCEEMVLTYGLGMELPLGFEPWREAGAILILSFTFLWQIPLFLWMIPKAGIVVSMIAGMVMNCLGTIETSLGELWFLNPFAIPARLMCPVLQVLPNGLPAREGSASFSIELLDNNVILPGLLLSLLWLFLAWEIGRIWFWRTCESGGRKV